MNQEKFNKQYKLYQAVKTIEDEQKQLSDAGAQLLATDNIIKMYLGLEDLNQEDPGEETHQTMLGSYTKQKEPVVLFSGLKLDAATAIKVLEVAARSLEEKKSLFLAEIDNLK